MGLACPLASGHEPMFAYESFVARTHIEAWERAYPWQAWKLVEDGPCGITSEGRPCAALEFGGSFSHLVLERQKIESLPELVTILALYPCTCLGRGGPTAAASRLPLISTDVRGILRVGPDFALCYGRLNERDCTSDLGR